MNRLGLGLAVGAGYLLGRTKKMKLAFAVGTMVAGKRMNLSPRGIADLVSQQLQNNPQFKEIGDQIRDDLRGVGKAASGALVERQIEGLADRLHGRTAQVRDQLAGVTPDLPGRSRDDDEPYDDEPYDEDDHDAYDDGDERNRRAGRDERDERDERENEPEPRDQDRDEEPERPRAKAPAKKAASRKPSGEGDAKTAAGKVPAQKKAAARKTAKKAPAKKTAVARQAASGTRSRSQREGGDR
ncbi:hypothetical protein GCM10010145_15840 [Streptomyces ruber]|uniref:DNA primase n=2 Tax=Streptomyces TaxID=1883 RepID=A0A918B959_9ACTN|nr:DNA primase [Streptomyces ruber]GGQ47610.1 hypothetical protein GCM10010145_15840 [Streptomyces ruber]